MVESMRSNAPICVIALSQILVIGTADDGFATAHRQTRTACTGRAGIPGDMRNLSGPATQAGGWSSLVVTHFDCRFACTHSGEPSHGQTFIESHARICY